MNLTTLFCAVAVGVGAYELGKKVQEFRITRDDEDFGILDLIKEYADNGNIFEIDNVELQAKRILEKLSKLGN